MQGLFSRLTLAAGLLGAPAAYAAEVQTAFGSFNAPDGVSLVNREEKPDKAGKPTGMAVYSRTDDSKAIFIVVWSYAEPDPAKPYDALDGAVKFGNPADKTLTRDAAKTVLVGGVEGGRYEGRLATGQRSISYVAVKNGHRLIVLLKAPPGSPYKELTEQFARGVEGFAWTLPAGTPASAAPQ